MNNAINEIRNTLVYLFQMFIMHSIKYIMQDILVGSHAFTLALILDSLAS